MIHHPMPHFMLHDSLVHYDERSEPELLIRPGAIKGVHPDALVIDTDRKRVGLPMMTGTDNPLEVKTEGAIASPDRRGIVESMDLLERIGEEMPPHLWRGKIA